MDAIIEEAYSFKIAPNGHPLIQECALHYSWAKTFSHSISEGLWALADATQIPDEIARFWRSVGSEFLHKIAERQHLASVAERTEVDISDHELAKLAAELQVPIPEGV